MARKVTAHVPMSFTDRVVSFFSPRAGAKRYAGRVALANLRRSYEGAHNGRLTDGWSATRGTAADAEIAVAASLLRDRMRDLVRNNAIAANCVQVLVSNLVGPGIRPRAKTGNADLDKKIDDLFEEWSKQCDAHGHTDFHGLVALAVREMVEGGEVFAIKRHKRPSQKRKVPLEIELMEADHLDSGKWNAEADGGRISQGIEYDRSGSRSAFWLFPDHPGDNSPLWGRSLVSKRVPASLVAHLFERQRVQSRGVPWGTPALRALQDHGDWQIAEMVRKKTEACMAAIVFGEDSDGSTGVAPAVEDINGNAIEQFEPGLIAYARNGKDIKFNQPGHAGGVREWNVTQLHLISAGFRVPYALATNDLREANFSSSRVGINEFRRLITMTQWLCIIPMFCQKLWDWFCDAAYTAGLIPMPVIPVEWSPPKFESVNPKQDAETDVMETRAGFTSLKEQISKRGYNAEKVLAEISEMNTLLDSLGLIFDSDPRHVTRQGMFQTEQSNEPPTDGSDDPAPGAEEQKE